MPAVGPSPFSQPPRTSLSARRCARGYKEGRGGPDRPHPRGADGPDGVNGGRAPSTGKEEAAAAGVPGGPGNHAEAHLSTCKSHEHVKVTCLPRRWKAPGQRRVSKPGHGEERASPTVAATGAGGETGVRASRRLHRPSHPCNYPRVGICTPILQMKD